MNKSKYFVFIVVMTAIITMTRENPCRSRRGHLLGEILAGRFRHAGEIGQ
jgi:hypothetical protein